MEVVRSKTEPQVVVISPSISFTPFILVWKDHFECLFSCLLLPSLLKSKLQKDKNLVRLLCCCLCEYLAQILRSVNNFGWLNE